MHNIINLCQTEGKVKRLIPQENIKEKELVKNPSHDLSMILMMEFFFAQCRGQWRALMEFLFERHQITGHSLFSRRLPHYQKTSGRHNCNIDPRSSVKKRTDLSLIDFACSLAVTVCPEELLSSSMKLSIGREREENRGYGSWGLFQGVRGCQTRWTTKEKEGGIDGGKGGEEEKEEGWLEGGVRGVRDEGKKAGGRDYST